MLRVPTLLLVFACASLACTSGGQPPGSPSGAEPTVPFAGQPAPEEVKIFADFVGTWKLEATQKPSAENNNTEVKLTGTETGQWQHNGYFVRVEGSVQSSNFRMEYTRLMTYDVNRKTYRRWVFASGGLAVESVGEWNAATKTMVWKPVSPSPNMTLDIKVVTEKDKYRETQVFKRDDGTLMRDLIWSGTRVK
jgi:hypothetical protein